MGRAWRLGALAMALTAVAGVTPFAVASAAHAAGRAWWVRPGANGDCTTEATPCGSVATAIARSSSGDVVFLLAGTYSANETITGAGSPTRTSHVTVRPADGASVVVSGSWTLRAPFVRLEGYRIRSHVLKVESGGSDLVVKGLIGTASTIRLSGGDRIQLLDNRITDNFHADMLTIGNGSDDVLVEGNTLLRGRDPDGVSGVHTDCLQLWGPSRNVMVRRNVIGACSNSPVMIRPTQGDIDDLVFERNVVQRCTPRDTIPTYDHDGNPSTPPVPRWNDNGYCGSFFAIQVAPSQMGKPDDGAFAYRLGLRLAHNTIDGGLLLYDKTTVEAVGNVITDGLDVTYDAQGRPIGTKRAGYAVKAESCRGHTFRSNVMTNVWSGGCTSFDASNDVGATVTFADREGRDLRLAAGSAGLEVGLPVAAWPSLNAKSAPIGLADAGAFEQARNGSDDDGGYGSVPTTTVPPSTTTTVATTTTTVVATTVPRSTSTAATTSTTRATVPSTTSTTATPGASRPQASWDFRVLRSRQVPSTGPAALALRVTTADGRAWRTPPQLTRDGLSLLSPSRLVTNQTPTALIGAVQRSKAISVEVWATPSRATSIGKVFAWSVTPYTNLHLTLQQGTSRTASDRWTLRVRTATGSIVELSSAAGTAMTGRRSHLVAVVGAGKAELWVDGRLAASKAMTLGAIRSGARIAFGSEPLTLYPRPWLGTLHAASIWDRALTPAEVSARAAAGPF